MYFTPFIRKILLPAVLACISLTAMAHDPGLSRAELRLDGQMLRLSVSLATQDFAALSPDGRFIGTLTEQMLETNAPVLEQLANQAVDIVQMDRKLLPQSIQWSLAGDDGVMAEWQFGYDPSQPLRLHMPLLGLLARNHRQYLSIWDGQGRLLSQHILDARSPLLQVQGSASSPGAVFDQYLVEGIWHIWTGFDHMLFLLTLLLPAVLVYRDSRWYAAESLQAVLPDIVRVITAFTLSHSMTLALAVLDVFTLPAEITEPLIAMSVLLTAANNLYPMFSGARWQLAFGFGLIHGYGFAGVMQGLELPADALLVSLLGFNLGVEAGQLVVVAIIMPLAGMLRHTRLYRQALFTTGSAATAIVAMLWLFERVSGRELLGL